MLKQYDVVLVNLDPTVGSEYQKTRPCVVISPDDMNAALNTIIIAPLTSKRRGWAFRPLVKSTKKESEVALDQMRAIDKKRVINTLGSLSKKDRDKIYEVLSQFFV